MPMEAPMDLAAPPRFNHLLKPAVAYLVIVGLTIGILLAMGRPLICTCGTVKFWHGAVNSAENSQHIADWYTFSHIIHGFIFYWVLWLIGKNVEFLKPRSVRLVFAAGLEAAWEILENTPLIIDRYREATIALGYTGDSVLNSTADIGFMSLGFVMACRLPVWVIVAIAIVFEVTAAVVIRDNLTLNVLMLTFPIDAVREWQGG
jgi:hypothetical protein